MQNARAEMETSRASAGQAKIQARKDEKELNAKIKRIANEESELDERTRYAKETGKDFKTGNPSEKGGTRSGDTAYDKVSRELRKTGGMMSSRRKPIQPQGKKKEKGKKGYQGVTPVDRIKGQLARKRAPKPDIGSRFD